MKYRIILEKTRSVKVSSKTHARVGLMSIIWTDINTGLISYTLITFISSSLNIFLKSLLHEQFEAVVTAKCRGDC